MARQALHRGQQQGYQGRQHQQGNQQKGGGRGGAKGKGKGGTKGGGKGAKGKSAKSKAGQRKQHQRWVTHDMQNNKYCTFYHGSTCRFGWQCKDSHRCPVDIGGGYACNKNHHASQHP